MFFLLTPDIELFSIASLSDIQALPAVPGPGLYRRSFISLAFKTSAHMENTLKFIIEDVKINARLQRIPITEFKVEVFEDSIPDPKTHPFVF